MRSLSNVLTLVLFTGIAVSSASAQIQAPRKLALLVGVTKYNHAKLSELRYAENDVVELGKVLTKQGFDVTVLTSTGGEKKPSAAPSAANIRTQLAKLLDNVTHRDMIVIGLAGHGLQILDQEESFFCPEDANPAITGEGRMARFTRPQTLLGINELLKSLDDSGIGQKLVLIDACRNDPSVRGNHVGVVDVSLATSPQTGVLLSCSPGEYAFEDAKFGKGHGAFFYHVIEGLNGEARNRDNVVTWNTLSDYVREKVPLKVKELFGENGGKQNPNQIGDLRGIPPVLARIEEGKVKPPKPDTPDSTGTSTTERPRPLRSPFSASEARAGQQAWAKYLGVSVTETNSIGMELVLVPPGTYTIGDPSGRSNAIKPQSATVDSPIYVGATEVTQGQWIEIMSTRPWSSSGVDTGPNYPAVLVSWDAANEFCEKLTSVANRSKPAAERIRYRLASEVEWEWFCRAGTEGQFSCPDSEIGQHAWFKGDPEVIHAVRSKRPNPFGLFDVHGNVAEWCGVEFPSGTSVSDRKVRRSGSANRAERYITSFAREHSAKPSIETGFRVVGVR
jgi:formylglycine-generating enzyme required for sulfatase activity